MFTLLSKKAWWSLLHVEGEGLLASAQTFLLWFFALFFFSFPDLPFQFGQLHWCIKLPINSHENQEIITRWQSIHLQFCAEIIQHTGRISNYIRKGCLNHAHVSRYPSRVLGCHPTLRPAERCCDPTRQGEKDKRQVPAVFQGAGLHEAPIPFISYLSTQLLVGARGFLSFGQAQSHKDRGEQEEGWCMSTEHPCLPHSLPKVHTKWAVCGEPSAMTFSKFPSDNSAGETFPMLETSAPGLSQYVNPTTQIWLAHKHHRLHHCLAHHKYNCLKLAIGHSSKGWCCKFREQESLHRNSPGESGRQLFHFYFLQENISMKCNVWKVSNNPVHAFYRLCGLSISVVYTGVDE